MKTFDETTFQRKVSLNSFCYITMSQRDDAFCRQKPFTLLAASVPTQANLFFFHSNVLNYSYLSKRVHIFKTLHMTGVFLPSFVYSVDNIGSVAFRRR